MTLRDRQRAFYFNKLEALEKYPSLAEKYEKRFKNYYQATCVNYKKMRAHFNQRCRELGIKVGQTSYEKRFGIAQLNLFNDYK